MTSSKPDEVRDLLARAIALEDDEEAQHDVIRRLHRGPAAETYTECLRLLAGVPTERVVACAVLAQLRTADSDYRRKVTTDLKAQLAHESTSVVAAAIYAFSHLGVEAVVPELIALSSAADDGVRLAVATALARARDAKTRDALVRLSMDVDDDVRNWATFSLGVQRNDDDTSVREALKQRLLDSNIETRHEAILGLAIRDDPSAAYGITAELAARRVSSPLLEAVELRADPRWLPSLCALHEERPDWYALTKAVEACERARPSTTA